MRLKAIIAISGRICSGKSYAANLIARQLNIPVASFGSYLKYYCEKNNLPLDRTTMQNLGENLVRTNAQEFLTNVINYFINGFDSIIIEGVRHKVILELIKLVGEKSISIYLETDTNTRFERCIKRNKDFEVKSREQFNILDNHIVEKEIESLKLFCDYIIDSNQDYSFELLNYITQKIS